MTVDTHIALHAGRHTSDKAHASLRGYLTGFALSVLLTAIPFWLVMTGIMDSKPATAITIMLFAGTQVVVHMIYFLHMNTRAEGGWTVLALIFTVIMVAIALTGSLWVMYHLDANMMPVHDMSRLP